MHARVRRQRGMSSQRHHNLLTWDIEGVAIGVAIRAAFTASNAARGGRLLCAARLAHRRGCTENAGRWMYDRRLHVAKALRRCSACGGARLAECWRRCLHRTCCFYEGKPLAVRAASLPDHALRTGDAYPRVEFGGGADALAEGGTWSRMHGLISALAHLGSGQVSTLDARLLTLFMCLAAGRAPSATWPPPPTAHGPRHGMLTPLLRRRPLRWWPPRTTSLLAASIPRASSIHPRPPLTTAIRMQPRRSPLLNMWLRPLRTNYEASVRRVASTPASIPLLAANDKRPRRQEQRARAPSPSFLAP